MCPSFMLVCRIQALSAAGCKELSPCRFGHVGKLYEQLLSEPGETWQCYFPCDGQEVSDAELAGYSVGPKRLVPST